MKATKKILEAQSIFIRQLGSDIKSMVLNKRGKELEISLINGITIYIVYNNYNQYSYSILYTNSKYDRLRYDNFDDQWEVKTKPHHTHIRGSKITEKNPMIGDPSVDIVKLILIIREQ